MRKQDQDLVVDFLTLVAAIGLSVFIADFTIKIRPPGEIEKEFQRNFAFAVFSFGIFYLLFHTIRYLFYLVFPKLSFSNRSTNFLWLPTIIAGACLFEWMTYKPPIFDASRFSLRLLFNLISILVPAAIFRLFIELVINLWREKIKTHSIVK